VPCRSSDCSLCITCFKILQNAAFQLGIKLPENIKSLLSGNLQKLGSMFEETKLSTKILFNCTVTTDPQKRIFRITGAGFCTCRMHFSVTTKSTVTKAPYHENSVTGLLDALIPRKEIQYSLCQLSNTSRKQC